MSEQVDTEHIEYLEGVLGIWSRAEAGGRSPRTFADMIFHAETGEALGGSHPAYDNAIDFCDFLTYVKCQRSLTTQEVIALAMIARELKIDISGSKRIRQIANAFSQAEQLRSGSVPSPLALAFVRWGPALALILAAIACLAHNFSWVVVTTALLAKFWNGFARYLAGTVGHSSSGMHSVIASVLLLASFGLSLLHLFRVANLV